MSKVAVSSVFQIKFHEKRTVPMTDIQEMGFFLQNQNILMKIQMVNECLF